MRILPFTPHAILPLLGVASLVWIQSLRAETPSKEETPTEETVTKDSPAKETAPQETAVFDITTADVPKVVILMFKPDRTTLEVTFNKKKQEEYTKLSAGALPMKIKFSINGKEIVERTITKPLTGHSIKFDMKSMDEAWELAKELMKSASPAPKDTAPKSTQ